MAMNKKHTIPYIPLRQHSGHQAEIRAGVGPHKAQYWCLDCDCHIAWVKQSHLNQLN